MNYPRFSSKVDDFLSQHPRIKQRYVSIIGDECQMDGETVLAECIDPMIHWMYSRIKEEVAAHTLNVKQAQFFIKEISVFARYNSQFLLQASKAVLGFCPELAQELLRNHLEEGGERGKLPAHYVIFSGALLKDLDLLVNGYVPQAATTRMLIWLHGALVNSHCPSTILGMYYATEAVAISETRELNRITNQLGKLMGKNSEADLPNLVFYYGMHLDAEHQAATNGKSVEAGHQDGIAQFIQQYKLFNFKLPLILDGFLQMIGPLIDQWTELNLISKEFMSSR